MRAHYAVIGHPVAHSKSPWIHAQFARATAQDLDYGRIEAPLEGFRPTVDRFRAQGGSGLNVTVPFKREAFDYCAAMSERARVAQAVNTLAFGDEIYGDNTDGVGLVRDLTDNIGCSLQSRSVLIMGAGGAAQGVVQALLDAGASRVVIANRTVERAQALARRFARTDGCGYAGLAGQPFDVVVNATSGGLSGESPNLPDGVLHGATLAYDMVYGRETPFLAAARKAGARTCDGLGMLVEQAAESFFVWRGVRPDTAPVLAALRLA